MRQARQWLDEYAGSHQHETNKLLHWICVPIIVVSVIGLLASLPAPQLLQALSPTLGWGAVLLIGTIFYYCLLSPRLAAGMVPVVVLIGLVVSGLERLPSPRWVTCLVLFVLAWIGQFIGHHIEGRRPSFFKDLQFLLIGPLWLLSSGYRRIGLRY